MAASGKEYTAAEVAEHSSEDSCWIILHGKVYDVTTFLKDHPVRHFFAGCFLHGQRKKERIKNVCVRERLNGDMHAVTYNACYPGRGQGDPGSGWQGRLQGV